MRFSVLIPTYNSQQFLRQAIDSVLAQTFTDYELIVIDDGSTDGTAAALEAYGTRIRVLRQKNQGPEVARNTGVAQAHGDYLVFLDHDDCLFESALSTYDVIIRECNSPPLIIGCRTIFTDDHPVPQPIEIGEIEVSIYPDYLSKNMDMGMSASLIVIRKSTFEEVGGARNCTPFSWHLNDFHLLLKAGDQSPCVVVRKPSTIAYRYHSGNSHGNHVAMVSAVLSLMDLERRGQFPGGKSRQRDRYSWIGNIASHWIRRLLKTGELTLVFRLLAQGTPMLATALPTKFIGKLRNPVFPPPLVLTRHSAADPGTTTVERQS